MLKKISAALIAVSMLAAPAMAEGVAKTGTAPVAKTTAAPVIKAETPIKAQVQPKVLNANAKMVRQHHRHFHKHHRFHNKVSAHRHHTLSKNAVIKTTVVHKRG